MIVMMMGLVDGVIHTRALVTEKEVSPPSQMCERMVSPKPPAWFCGARKH